MIFLRTSLAALLLVSVSVSLAWSDDFPAPFNSEPEPTSPMSAEEAATTASLPPGFHCEVFASEPDVQQPIAMCFDNRGRLWIAECYTYAEQPDRWDLSLRDRIIILEDTNDDGRADKRTVFWDEGTRLTSLACGTGGVWALCAPNLIFIPDANGDDVPDSAPIVALDGFDVGSAGHNVVNGLKLGPDGWLYGRHGITATSLVGQPETPESQRVQLNCSIWRYQPQRKLFEVFCNGGTNPWGLDWNADGQLFYTNTVIGHLWHAIPGAFYERMFGTHLNRHFYQSISHTADHVHWDDGSEKWSDIRAGVSDRTSALGGGHAHMGCLIIKGTAWPEQYRGNLFTCNLHGRRVNMDVLKREGCGYVATHGPDFLVMQDPFFRGLDLLTGPDGQMWINDWSDTGECHDNTGLHRTSGRIFRVIYDGATRSELAVSNLPAWLTQRTAGPVQPSQLEGMFASKEEAQRAMAVRWLSEDSSVEATTIDRLSSLAQHDSSGLVRLEIAAALQRVPLEQRLPLAAILSAHAEDADDRQQPLMIWYGIADAVPSNTTPAVKLALSSNMPLLGQLISRRICEQMDDVPQAVDQLLLATLQSKTASSRLHILRGMNEALRGRARVTAPSAWKQFSSALGADATDEELGIVRELSVVFGDGRARAELLSIAANTSSEPIARRSALESLLRDPSDDLLPHLLKWENDKVISREAVRGLAHFDGPQVSQRLIQHWQRHALDRTAAIDSLVASRAHAAALLEAIASEDLPSDALSPYQARQIVNLDDPRLLKRLQEVWGEIRESPAEKQRELAKWKSTLTTEALTSASLVAGKGIFMKQCANCHQLYGDGKKVGPNLTGSDRHNLDYLLSNIIDPNAVVPADYRMSVYLLEGERVVSGVISQESEHSVTLQTPEGERVIDKALITETKPSSVSIMPEGVLAQLSEENVRDLIAYLQTTGPIETPSQP